MHLLFRFPPTTHSCLICTHRTIWPPSALKIRRTPIAPFSQFPQTRHHKQNTTLWVHFCFHSHLNQIQTISIQKEHLIQNFNFKIFIFQALEETRKLHSDIYMGVPVQSMSWSQINSVVLQQSSQVDKTFLSVTYCILLILLHSSLNYREF